MSIAHLAHMSTVTVSQCTWIAVDALLALGVQHQSIRTGAAVIALRVLAAMRTSAIVRFTFVDVMTVEMQQPIARFATAIIAALRINAILFAFVQARRTLVHIHTASLIRGQFEATLTATRIRSDQIQADIRTVTVVLNAFIHIDARLAIVAQLKSAIAFALAYSTEIVARVLTAAVISAWINCFAHTAIGQNVVRRTLTLSRSRQIDTDMRAIAIVYRTLVVIEARAGFVVTCESRIANALPATLTVDTLMIAAAIIQLALVHIHARLFVRLQRITIVAFAYILISVANMLAATVVLVTQTAGLDARFTIGQ